MAHRNHELERLIRIVKGPNFIGSIVASAAVASASWLYHRIDKSDELTSARVSEVERKVDALGAKLDALAAELDGARADVAAVRAQTATRTWW